MSAEAWFYDAVHFVMGIGLFDAAGEDTFAPGAPMTRAMLAEALYRLTINDEQLTISSVNSEFRIPNSQFTDVDEDAWYHDAVMWASSVGVVTGMGNGIFAPDDSITREQIATMLYRYATYRIEKGELRKENEDDNNSQFSTLNSQFTYANKISTWAAEAMDWAVTVGIIAGMGDGTVAPQGTATRAQVAQILYNYKD